MEGVAQMISLIHGGLMAVLLFGYWILDKLLVQHMETVQHGPDVSRNDLFGCVRNRKDGGYHFQGCWVIWEAGEGQNKGNR